MAIFFIYEARLFIYRETDQEDEDREIKSERIGDSREVKEKKREKKSRERERVLPVFSGKPPSDSEGCAAGQ